MRSTVVEVDKLAALFPWAKHNSSSPITLELVRERVLVERANGYRTLPLDETLFELVVKLVNERPVSAFAGL